MYSSDLGKISSRTTKNKLIKISGSKEVAIETRINALNQLSLKKDIDSTEFFDKIFKDKKEHAIVKSNLVLRLGSKLKAIRSLENFLGKEGVMVDRSILHVLAYKGNAKTIEKINTFIKENKSNKPAIAKAKFVKTLISYRLGDNKFILPKCKSENFESFRGIKAESIEHQKLTPIKAKKIIAELTDDHIAVPLSSEKAQELSCQGKKLSILLNEKVIDNTYNYNANGIIASIIEDDYCPGGHFIKYHVLASKERKTSNYSVHIINPNGRLIMEGTGSKKNNELSFEVKAIKRSGSTPIVFNAAFNLDKADMKIKEAKSGTTLRKSSRIQLTSLNRD